MPLVIAFLMGAVTGSFLNVCIFRIPAGESLVFPASHCLSCRRPIAWRDNIPIVSYFLLKGRCRACGTSISPQYPLIEWLAAVFFAVFYAHFGLSVKGVCYLGLSLALMVVSAIDLRHQVIPDEITLPGILVGMAVSSIWPEMQGSGPAFAGFVHSVIGALVGGGILYVAGSLAEWVLKKEAMGGGDVKLLAMIGAFLGWKAVLWTLVVSSFLGSIVGIYLRLSKGEERIPFGPYLSLAAVLYFFFGPSFLNWYLGMGL